MKSKNKNLPQNLPQSSGGLRSFDHAESMQILTEEICKSWHQFNERLLTRSKEPFFTVVTGSRNENNRFDKESLSIVANGK
jgi:hypothetical protein